MTRIVLIHAGPTQWDVEGRLTGNHPLPLTESARAAIEQIAAGLSDSVSSVHCYKKNEACHEAAKIVARGLKLPVSDNSALDEMKLGLWQGLTRNELKFRYPKVVTQWEQNPLLVQPPEGETLEEAIDRLRGGLRRILRKKRGPGIVLPLRPLAMQIMLGILLRQEPLAIASHLPNTSPSETIELSDEALQELIS
ncbi:MAG TPA: histidine phosphatase family protein [Tepidisphaeraceae bacterium]|jgi:broad specificity phosphatase PhoE